MMKLFAAKILLQLFMFVLFLVAFGVPSLKRYFAKDVLTKVQERSMKDLQLPAVTICPRQIYLCSQAQSQFQLAGLIWL